MIRSQATIDIPAERIKVPFRRQGFAPAGRRSRTSDRKLPKDWPVTIEAERQTVRATGPIVSVAVGVGEGRHR